MMNGSSSSTTTTRKGNWYYNLFHNNNNHNNNKTTLTVRNNGFTTNNKSRHWGRRLLVVTLCSIVVLSQFLWSMILFQQGEKENGLVVVAPNGAGGTVNNNNKNSNNNKNVRSGGIPKNQKPLPTPSQNVVDTYSSEYWKQLQESLHHQWEQLEMETTMALPKVILPLTASSSSSSVVPPQPGMMTLHNNSTTTNTNTKNNKNKMEDNVSVTLHLSPSKLNRIRFLLHRWGGPASAAIYLSNVNDITTFVQFVQAEYQKPIVVSTTTTSTAVTSSSSSSWRQYNMFQNTTFHVLLQKTTNVVDGYPHNRLRQLALSNCECDFFVTLDADFVTLPNGHDQLVQILVSTSPSSTTSTTTNPPKSVATILKQEKMVMVLPAFNHEQILTDDQLDDSLFPHSRQQVLQMMDTQTITPFHVQKFFEGHGPTNYSQWYHRTTATASSSGGGGGNGGGVDDEELYYPITYAPKYEPYILGYRHSSSSSSSSTTLQQQQQQRPPPYWTGFYGFGFDKYSWFLELHYSGYQFAVLYDMAIFHLDHPYRDGHALSAHNRHEMEAFVLHLMTTYQAPALDFDEDFDIQLQKNKVASSASSTTDHKYTVAFRKIKDKRRRNKLLEKLAAEKAAVAATIRT